MYSTDFQASTAQTAMNSEEEPANNSLTTKITRYLRWVGSILIIASAVSFMLQGHEDMLPSYRYWVGLGFTLLLCGGGLICTYLFRETKGARIFFGLGAAFLPVQVSQVSAMIYAYWHGQAALQPPYRWLQFMDVSPFIIAVDFLISAAMLIVVGYASFAMLARKHLKTLLWTFLTANALLLLPVRDAAIIPFLIAGLFIFLRQTEKRLHNDSSMRLPEGMAARALISLPLWIIIGRSLLHPASYLFAIVVSVIVTVYCIVDIKRYTRSVYLIYIAQWLGTVSAIAIWLIIVEQFAGLSNDRLSALLPVAVILFALSGKIDYHARLYRFISSMLALLLTYGAMLDQQTLAPVFAIATGILLTVAGMNHREKASFFSGNLCVAGGFLFYWDYAVNLYTSAPWISSIGLGLLVILLASYLENKDQQILAKSRYYFNELKNWN